MASLVLKYRIPNQDLILDSTVLSTSSRNIILTSQSGILLLAPMRQSVLWVPIDKKGNLPDKILAVPFPS